MNWHSFFFLLFSLVCCGFAIAVVATSNVVRMAFYLVISLSATAGLFFLAGADFVGAMQLMIYVGGTLVLLIFGVMLTAQRAFVSMRTAGGEWILAAIVGSVFLMILVQAAFRVESWTSPTTAEVPLEEQVTATRLGMGFLGLRVDGDAEADASTQTAMTGYLLPFEIISIHLLVVLVGAAYLARPKRRARQEAS